MGVVGGQDAGVDPGAAADVEEMAMPPHVDGRGKRLREVEAAAIHRRGERRGELLGLHRLVPVLAGILRRPVRRLARSQHLEQIPGNRAILERRVIRLEVPRRAPGEMLAAGLGEREHAVALMNQAHRAEQRQHHVGGARGKAVCGAHAGQRRRMRAEPREEVQVEADDEQVGGVQRVAITVEECRVRARAGGELRIHVEVLPPGQRATS